MLCRSGSFPINGQCKTVGNPVNFAFETLFQILDVGDNINFTTLVHTFELTFENEVLLGCEIVKCETSVFEQNGTFFIHSKQKINFPCTLNEAVGRLNGLKDSFIFLEDNETQSNATIMLTNKQLDSSEDQVAISWHVYNLCPMSYTITKAVFEDCSRIQVLKSELDSFNHVHVFDILTKNSLDTQHIYGSEDVLLTVCWSDYMSTMAASNTGVRQTFEWQLMIVFPSAILAFIKQNYMN